MGRLLQAAVLVMGMVSVVGAGPTRKVRVESTPPGATVYIDDVGNGAKCEATPCTIDVAVGARTIIVQLAKYGPEFVPVTVTKGSRPMPVSVKLVSAVGTIRILNAPKGASVKVNDEDKGKVGKGPMEIEVPAEPVSVVITFNGKTQTEMVDVVANDAVEIEYSGGSTAVAVADTGGGEESGSGSDEEHPEGGNDGSGTDGGGEVSEPAVPAQRAPYLEAGLAMDIGFRRFSYTDGTNPFNNDGEIVLGPAVELWPGRMLGVKPLRGLSLFARFQFAVTHQQVTRESMGMVTDVGASTFWGALEVSLRQKWVFGSIGLEVSGGYVRDQLEFSADNATVLDMVPSADYKSLRIGGKVSYVAAFEPYIAAENRIVLDGGELANRADSADASGYGFKLGVRTKLGPVGARAEFAYAKYSWTFSNTSTTTAPPPGATDTIMWLSILAGYDY